MATYSIDTAAAIRKLKEAQCDEPLAEAIVEIVAASHDEIAPKTDLEVVRKDIERLEASTKTDLEVVRSDLRAELAKLHTQVILWIVGTGIAILGGGKFLDVFLEGG